MYAPPPPDASSSGASERYSATPHTAQRGSRLQPPALSQWLLLAGSALILIGTALPWWAITLPVVRDSAIRLTQTGLTTASGKAVAVLGVLLLVLTLLRLVRVPLPGAISSRERAIYVVLASEALLLTLLALLDGVQVFAIGGFVAVGTGFVTVGTGIGLYLALVGTVAAIAGGWLYRAGASWLL
jgi:hypothetical protein